MARRTGIVATLGAALLASGCASWGLSPVPKRVDAGRGLRPGLDITPDRMTRWPDAGLGLNPFPDEVESGENPGTGLSILPFSGQPEGVAEASFIRHRPTEPESPPTRPVAPAPPRNDPPETPVRAPASTVPPKMPKAPAPAPRLLLKFTRGETLRYRSSSETVIKSPMFGEDGMKMNVGMDLTRKTVDVTEAGDALLENTIESVAMLMDNPMLGGEFKFDTKDEASMDTARENPVLGQMVDGFAGLVGQALTLTQAPSGELKESVGLAMLAQMTGGMGGNDGGAQLTGISAPFPDLEVREGLTWEFNQGTVSPVGTLTLSGTMKIAKYDAATRRAVITQEGTVTLTPPENVDEGDGQAQMAAMTEMKDAKVTGEMVFDLASGRIVSSRTVSKMVIENPMMGGEMEIDAVMTLELVE